MSLVYDRYWMTSSSKEVLACYLEKVFAADFKQPASRRLFSLGSLAYRISKNHVPILLLAFLLFKGSIGISSGDTQRFEEIFAIDLEEPASRRSLSLTVCSDKYQGTLRILALS